MTWTSSFKLHSIGSNTLGTAFSVSVINEVLITLQFNGFFIMYNYIPIWCSCIYLYIEKRYTGYSSFLVLFSIISKGWFHSGIFCYYLKCSFLIKFMIFFCCPFWYIMSYTPVCIFMLALFVASTTALFHTLNYVIFNGKDFCGKTRGSWANIILGRKWNDRLPFQKLSNLYDFVLSLMSHCLGGAGKCLRVISLLQYYVPSFTSHWPPGDWDNMSIL